MCSKFVWYEANVYMPESPTSDAKHVTVAKRASFCMEFDFGHSVRPMCWPSSKVSVSRTTLLSLRARASERTLSPPTIHAQYSKAPQNSELLYTLFSLVLSLSLFVLFASKSLLRRFRFARDIDRILRFALAQNLRLAAQSIPFIQLCFPEFLSLHLGRCAQHIFSIGGNNHPARPALAVSAAVEEFVESFVDFNVVFQREISYDSTRG